MQGTGEREARRDGVVSFSRPGRPCDEPLTRLQYTEPSNSYRPHGAKRTWEAAWAAAHWMRGLESRRDVVTYGSNCRTWSQAPPDPQTLPDASGVTPQTPDTPIFTQTLPLHVAPPPHKGPAPGPHLYPPPFPLRNPRVM